MELTFQYFWIIKLILLTAALATVYKAIITHRLKSKFWGITAIVFGLIYLTAPVKMGYKVDIVQQQRHIEAAKSLPPKVEDTSFKQKTQSLESISKDEIWDSTH